MRAFGINAWSVENAGDPVIPEHDERQTAARGAVRRRPRPCAVHGRRRRARRTAGDDRLRARPGGAPWGHRGGGGHDRAVGRREAGKSAFSPSPWEWTARAFQPYQEGDYDAALAGFREGHERFPADWTLLYNMGCMEALLGRRDEAIEHLRAAFELGADADPLADDDLASLRDDSELVAIAREADARRERA